MSRYKPYSAYKDSGVEWIGMVPEHWEVMPVKFRFDARLGKMIKPASSSDSDMLIPYHRAQTVQWESIDDAAVEEMWASPSDIKKFSVKTGDLLICEGGDVCRSAIVKSSPWDDLIYQNSIHRVRAKDQYSVDWILRLMQHLRSSGWIDVLCNKNTIVHFTSEKLEALPCAFPSPKEASNIVDNLNRETTRIDTLIAKKTRFIELLKEKRQALITHAVTKGLDPNVKMKDSGVEWIGEVPEHWEVRPIKAIVSTPITDGPHETPHFYDEGVPFVSAEAISGGFLNFEKIRGYISKEAHATYSKKYKPQKNDIFMIKSGATTGVTAIVDTDAEFNIWSPLAVIRCGNLTVPFFALNYMRSHSFQEGVSQNWSFGTQQNIGMGVIGDLQITVPPLSEQKVISTYLKSRLDRLDLLSKKTQCSIDLLKERRSAFITAAVTGQIDFR